MSLDLSRKTGKHGEDVLFHVIDKGEAGEEGGEKKEEKKKEDGGDLKWCNQNHKGT